MRGVVLFCALLVAGVSAARALASPRMVTFTLMLVSPEGPLPVRIEGGAVQVPVGEYRLAGWRLETRDRDDAVWVAQGRGENGVALSVRSGPTPPRSAARGEPGHAAGPGT